jgi:hypothetical protein
MRTLCITGLLAVCMLAGCASERGESVTMAGFDFSSITKVAVLDPSGDVYGETVKNQIADFFIFELMSKGYQCAIRADMKKVLDEQDFQSSDVTSEGDAAKIGKILNVPVVMLVNVPKFEQKISVTAKLVRVEDGAILWIGEGSGSTGKTLSTIAGAVVGAAAGVAVAGGDSNDRVVGGVIGGIVGGVVGNALSPEQEEQFKKIIKKKVCKDLPARMALN